MKIIVIGGTGTIGRAVVKELSQRHTVIAVAHQHGDIHVDICDQQSIDEMYKKTGKIDSVVLTTGALHFAPLAAMKSEHYEIGLKSKLMGQVNVVLSGIPHLNDGGSFTLTSGLLNHDPIIAGSSAGMVNGAIDGFVTSAAIELPRGIRINAVSPTVLTESLAVFGAYMRGFPSVDAAEVARWFSKSVEGAQTGKIYQAGYCL